MLRLNFIQDVSEKVVVTDGASLRDKGNSPRPIVSSKKAGIKE